ncbi:MAG: photosystem I reaction center subunit XII [Bacteroidia bacterium]|jgi:photosystem I reaction center subunit XII
MHQKTKQAFIILIVAMISGILAVKLLPDFDNPIFMLIPILLFGWFGFNLIVRNRSSMKNYFTSKYNFSTVKYRSTIESDIPKDLVFQKLMEVLESSSLKIRNTNPGLLEFFATSRTTIWSWGENVYIKLEEHQGKTQIVFCITTIFGILSMGRIEEHAKEILNSFEEALII